MTFGPAAGLFLGAGIAAAARLVPALAATSIYRELLLVTLGWSVLNLLPILPLDGGRSWPSSWATKGRPGPSRSGGHPGHRTGQGAVWVAAAIIRAVLKVTVSMDAKYEIAPDSTTVEIFGQTYNVRGDRDPDYLMELARFVDSRMRDVAAQVATVDPAKIAILAALNIADEFSRYRKQREDAAGIWVERTEEISDRLSEVIG